MSADNWGVCPKCKQNAEKKVETAYGKVSEDEYLSLLQKKAKSQTEQTLREDYEIGVDSDGEFSISYSCSCSACGFKFEHQFSQDCLAG